MHFLIGKKTESFSARSVAMDVNTWSKGIKCGICKDYFKDPTTLPCGHNFCKGCISNQWDTVKYLYVCPDCSKTFLTRPELPTNETLAVIGNKLQQCTLQDSVQDGMVAELRNKLRDKRKEEGKLQKMLCAHPERPLNFYCRDDQKCICEECYYFTHREHNKVAIHEERKEREVKSHFQRRFHCDFTFLLVGFLIWFLSHLNIIQLIPLDSTTRNTFIIITTSTQIKCIFKLFSHKNNLIKKLHNLKSKLFPNQFNIAINMVLLIIILSVKTKVKFLNAEHRKAFRHFWIQK